MSISEAALQAEVVRLGHLNPWLMPGMTIPAGTAPVTRLALLVKAGLRPELVLSIYTQVEVGDISIEEGLAHLQSLMEAKILERTQARCAGLAAKLEEDRRRFGNPETTAADRAAIVGHLRIFVTAIRSDDLAAIKAANPALVQFLDLI